MSQAKYVTMLASEDPELPKPESTAIMSGIRELSFASKGQLRSIDMLKTPVQVPEDNDGDETLFELYAMHSKGVTALNIKRKDLGWGPDNKVLKAVDAVKAGFVSISPIHVAVGEASTATNEAPSKARETVSSEVLSSTKEDGVIPSISPHAPLPDKKVEPAAAAAPTNGAIKLPAKKESTAEKLASQASQTSNPAIITPESYAMAAEAAPEKSPAPEPSPVPKASVSPAAQIGERDHSMIAAQPNLSNGDTKVDLEALTASMARITDSFNKEFESLYQKIEGDRRVQDAAASSRQNAILHLVSSTLTDNVEKSLDKIVMSSIQQMVLPALTDIATSVIDKRLSEALSQHIGSALPKEVKAALPAALTRAMQDKEVHRVVAEQTASKLGPQIEQTFTSLIKNQIVPNFSNMAISIMQKGIADVERRFAEQFHQAAIERQQEDRKLEQVSSVLTNLVKTVHDMATSQSAFQDQILRLRQSGAELDVPGSGSTRSTFSGTGSETPVIRSAEDEEVQLLNQLMKEGRYEEGTIKWIQSSRQSELFDRFFVRVNPQYLHKLSPLVVLSVSACVTSAFSHNVKERLEWLDIILEAIDFQDPEIAQVAPRVFDVLQQRMSGAYMQIAEVNPADPALRRVSNLSRKINDLLRILQST